MAYSSAAVREALKSYWEALTPQAEREAYAKLRDLGLPPSYNEHVSAALQRLHMLESDLPDVPLSERGFGV